jgi:glucan biosynthesis protein
MKTFARILALLLLLVTVPLPAETSPEIDVEKLFALKKELVKDNMQLTESEAATFWLLHDDYEKKAIDIFNRRASHIRKYIQEHKNLSDEMAKLMMRDYLQIEADALKNKRALVAKLSKKLPLKTVYQFFVFEELVEAGFFSQIAENLPPIE